MVCLFSFRAYCLLNYFGTVLQSIDVIILLQNYFLADILLSIYIIFINLLFVNFYVIISFIPTPISHTPLSVSYTHLDVYKRQDWP